MTKNSHVFSSISTITIIILPILLALGLLIWELIYPIMEVHSDDWSLFFTISGIVTLILLLLPPPPNKKKRNIFLSTIKSVWKKFAKPKLTEAVKFDSDVVHFATVKESTEDTPIDTEVVNDDFTVTELSLSDDEQQPQNHASICSKNLRKNAKIRMFCSKLIAPFINVRSNFSKNSLFKIQILCLFLRSFYREPIPQKWIGYLTYSGGIF